uniref:mediator of RNA polymerase II transcription subunit 27-like n=1 Tax=Ciona intestinalis TaxID=7719 RepID=UPI00006A5B3C|nr:mediator of RNA polymerase II transcription subunit 27-like [Ciona intestinalis]|eukprot:XP_002131337.1 mediator of RNA polymerase II transcription subunit 27-like [Ciona intestinalis]
MADTINQAKLTISCIAQAITSTQQLRSTVTNVFNLLCEGVKPDEDHDGRAEETETSAGSLLGRDRKKFLQKFQEHLQAVNKDYNEVEKYCNSMIPTPELQVLGPLSHLSLDSNTDKKNTFRDAVQTYEWNQRMHEYAQIASSILLSHQLKRSQSSGGAILAKRRRALPPKFQNMSSQHVENTLQLLARQPADLTFKLIKTLGDTRILQVTVGRVFTVILMLRNLLMEKVLVKGLDEELYYENGTIDLFSESQFECMRRITDHAMTAVLQYSTTHATQPEIPLKYFLLWLQSYKNLFIDPCSICGKHLDGGLPPVWRDFRNPVACHDTCRP